MAVFGGITSGQVSASATGRLQALRAALQDCQNMNEWLAGLSDTDLGAINFDAGDADALKSAFADAGALWQLYDQGTVPSSYSTNMTINAVYVFGASQRVILGPS